jgi:alpha-L-fucosidase
MGFHQLRENFFRENLALQAAAFSIQGGKNVKLPALTDGNRDTYVKLAAGDSGSIEVKLNTPREFNTIALAEFLGLGQQVSAFKVELWVDQNFVEVARGTTIGNTRILQFPRHRSDRVRVTILSSKAAPALGEISLYNAPAY